MGFGATCNMLVTCNRLVSTLSCGLNSVAPCAHLVQESVKVGHLTTNTCFATKRPFACSCEDNVREQTQPSLFCHSQFPTLLPFST
jgi:hypothetical protein